MLSSNKLCFILPFLAVTLAAGCRGEDPLGRLRRENPFTRSQEEAPRELMFVTCRYTVLEYPESVDLTVWPFWTQYELTGVDGAGYEGVVEGFQAGQIRQLKENGLRIAVAPLSQWEPFRKEMVAQMAREHPTRMAIIRSSVEFLDIPAFWSNQERSLFVWSAAAGLRGYTLGPGQWVLHTSCSPGAPAVGLANRTVRLRILPLYCPAPSAEWGTEPGAMTRTGPAPILFEDMALDGVLRNGYFIAMTAGGGVARVGHPGDLILKEPPPGAVTALIAWVPVADTATESHITPR